MFSVAERERARARVLELAASDPRVVAGAVVVETGGVLSHAATVAREFGIPAVVMVKDATRIIRDGDSVTVDAAAGTVTIAR